MPRCWWFRCPWWGLRQSIAVGRRIHDVQARYWALLTLNGGRQLQSTTVSTLFKSLGLNICFQSSLRMWSSKGLRAWDFHCRRNWKKTTDAAKPSASWAVAAVVGKSQRCPARLQRAQSIQSCWKSFCVKLSLLRSSAMRSLKTLNPTVRLWEDLGIYQNASALLQCFSNCLTCSIMFHSILIRVRTVADAIMCHMIRVWYTSFTWRQRLDAAGSKAPKATKATKAPCTVGESHGRWKVAQSTRSMVTIFLCGRSLEMGLSENRVYSQL